MVHILDNNTITTVLVKRMMLMMMLVHPASMIADRGVRPLAQFPTVAHIVG